VSDLPSYERLLGLVDRLSAQVVELQRVVTVQAEEIAELKRRLSTSPNPHRRKSFLRILPAGACMAAELGVLAAGACGS
jgi:hypothetical protein